MTGETILEEASRIVDGDRQNDYGPPHVNHERTAKLWSAYLGVEVTPRQVCILNLLQKCSRDANAAKRDNLVDIAGWAYNAEECLPRRKAEHEPPRQASPGPGYYDAPAGRFAAPVKDPEFRDPLS